MHETNTNILLLYSLILFLIHKTSQVLNEVNVAHAGIPQEGLTSLCPNVVDLDLANNMLKDWSEVLNIMHHLPGLKFVNIADNKLVNSEVYTICVFIVISG